MTPTPQILDALRAAPPGTRLAVRLPDTAAGPQWVDALLVAVADRHDAIPAGHAIPGLHRLIIRRAADPSTVICPVLAAVLDVRWAKCPPGHPPAA